MRVGAEPRPFGTSIRWSDPAILKLLALALVAYGFAWWRIEGYPLADAIGYVDRAKTFVDTGGLEAAERNLRSFTFPFVFTPVFAVAELCGVEDLRFAMTLARALQVLLALLTVAATARLGARWFGRQAGLLGAALLAVAPVFAFHATMPVADIAAALYLAFAWERLSGDQGDRRRVVGGGLAAGLSFLISYKTLVLHLLFGLCLLGRDRFRRPLAWTSLFAGLAVCTLLQIGVDRVVYGQWGHSVLNYLYDNVFGTLTGLCFRIAERLPFEAIAGALIAFGTWSYETMAALRDYEVGSFGTPREQMPVGWYVRHAYDLLVPPVLVLLACAVVRAVVLLLPGRAAPPAGEPALGRVRWAVWTTLAIVGCYVLVLSQKGNKSFRLLIPLLPILLPFVAWGAQPLVAFVRRRLGSRVLALAAAGFGALTLAFGVWGFERNEPRAYGGYWDAMEYVNRRVAADPPARPVRVASAHYFAVFLRNAPGVRHEKFRAAPWLWEKDSGPEAQLLRTQLWKALSEVDWLLQAHTQLMGRPLLIRGVQAQFEIETAYWGDGNSDQVGPVYVLRSLERGRDPADARSFFRLVRDIDPDTWSAERGLGAPLHFERTRPDGSREAFSLLGWELENLPETDQGWMRFHWTGATELTEPFRIFVRWVGARGEVIGTSHHSLCYGELDARSWVPGWVLSEGYLVDIDDIVAEPPPGASWDAPFARVELAIGTAGPRGEPDPEGVRLRPVDRDADDLGFCEIGRVWKLSE